MIVAVIIIVIVVVIIIATSCHFSQVNKLCQREEFGVVTCDAIVANQFVTDTQLRLSDAIAKNYTANVAVSMAKNDIKSTGQTLWVKPSFAQCRNLVLTPSSSTYAYWQVVLVTYYAQRLKHLGGSIGDGNIDNDLRLSTQTSSPLDQRARELAEMYVENECDAILRQAAGGPKYSGEADAIDMYNVDGSESWTSPSSSQISSYMYLTSGTLENLEPMFQGSQPDFGQYLAGAFQLPLALTPNEKNFLATMVSTTPINIGFSIANPPKGSRSHQAHYVIICGS